MRKYFLYVFLIALIINSNISWGQVPFVCDGTAYVMFKETDNLSSFTIDPTNNAILYNLVEPNLGYIDAIGFNPSNNLLYGIRNSDYTIVTIDALGDIRELGQLSLLPPTEILAGDIDASGRYYHVMLSANEIDQKVLIIDLLSTDFSFTELNIPGNSNYSDLAKDPSGNFIYAANQNPNFVSRINLGNGQTTNFDVTNFTDQITGLYFDPFGELIGFGSTAFGIASALFKIDKNAGNMSLITTGPQSETYDVAACPYTVAAQYATEFDRILPCSEIEYSLSIANASSSSLQGVDIDISVPAEFEFLGFSNNPFGGTINFNNGSSVLEFRNITIPVGVNEILIQINVDDIAADEYDSRAEIYNLPANLGSIVFSDDPSTIRNDATIVELLRPATDSSLHRFICLGESLLLDASEFGNNLEWQDGSTDPVFEVTEGGTYTLTSQNDCIDLNIEFDITVASCPFTIGTDHIFEPDSTLSCSEIKMIFIMINDSGITHENITFRDSLPDNIEFLEVLKNPYGGTLNTSTPSNIIEINGLTFNSVIDTIIISAYVGEIPPGDYYNASIISGFPDDIGFFRESDDPDTPPIDSTILTVLGVAQDSLQVELFLCEGSELELDGTPYGINHSWSTGEMTPIISVDEVGQYILTAFNGCDPAFIFFNVEPAADIDINMLDSITIRLGEDILLDPEIYNEGDSLFYSWVDDLQTPSLSCLECLTPTAFPLNHSQYTVYASNESCTDSLNVRLTVDNTRRLYIPNIFSPNGDGVNEMFSINSPDYGIIKTFQVIDRWGNLIFETESMIMNDEMSGWNGRAQNSKLNDGVYTWYAQIEFLDGLIESFTGSITLIN